MHGLQADFLEGRSDEAIASLDGRMRTPPRSVSNFERAAMYAIKSNWHRLTGGAAAGRLHQPFSTRTSSPLPAIDGGDETAFRYSCASRARSIGRESFVLPHTKDDDRAELLASFLSQFYDQATAVPSQRSGAHRAQSGADVIAEWLSDKRKAHAGP